ncbi:hypothetical protein [Caldibacillus debilis]|uniref:hypothetical protein n=1 Tax=Caldibacillus debilis TaxID=301148 RepID=UPI001B7F7C0A|nr:hypothetical protein [Caldibacillus debilis]
MKETLPAGEMAAIGRDAGRLCRGDGKILKKRPWEASRHECRSIIQKSGTFKIFHLGFCAFDPLLAVWRRGRTLGGPASRKFVHGLLPDDRSTHAGLLRKKNMRT